MGASSDRYSLSVAFQRDRAEASWLADLYFIRYSLDLFSNFTYRLADPEQGDQLEQVDERSVLGGSARLRKPLLWAGREHLLELGVETRNDFIDEVALYTSRARKRTGTIRQNDVVESTARYEREDARTVNFPVTIAKDGEAVVRYRVRYRW